MTEELIFHQLSLLMALSCRCGEGCQGCELMAEVESIAVSGLAHEINWALRQKVTRSSHYSLIEPASNNGKWEQKPA